eukprot:CAMPEP_0204518674 /NCGR_PEP_ID=MMETSP0661-20131031/4323_1 /ASSEMBLY_ACC=CAM_ASM_000606 /TAXON_ID=109239 /ORGANISM="Alexandrium margalefi, Strain AMGDE01CS-322" /LENGTH=377 /DNA_ID=CAMNT_0051524131 /DNA_START=27 /DNA_END=1160 /DNA_ORIENTATION=+
MALVQAAAMDSCKETPKKHRVSGGKAGAVVDGMAAEQRQSDVEQYISELAAACRIDSELLAQCRALMSRRRKKLDSKPLPRGVSALKDIPDYLAKEVLAQCSGADPAIFQNQDSADNKTILVWALGGNEKYQFPSKCMAVEDAVNWLVGWHAQQGNKLKPIQWNLAFTDFDWTLGCYGFVPPGGHHDNAKAYDIITHIVKHDDKSVRALPAGWQPRYGEVGVGWMLKNNFNEEACSIQRVSTKAQMQVACLFALEAEQADVTNGLRTRRGRQRLPAAAAGGSAPGDGHGQLVAAQGGGPAAAPAQDPAAAAVCLHGAPKPDAACEQHDSPPERSHPESEVGKARGATMILPPGFGAPDVHPDMQKALASLEERISKA